MEEGHDSKGYEVGYGKPPIHSRFRKGQSGNRKGRPRGTNNLKTDLAQELKEKVLVREGERSLKISKQKAIVKTLVARTLKGDAKAASTLLKVMGTDDSAAHPERPLTDFEREILEDHDRRIIEESRAAEIEAKERDSK